MQMPRFANAAKVCMAFLYGVLLGVLWECASMGVLLLATIMEYFAGTFIMTVAFVGIAGFAFSIAARADLARPLFSILLFRLSAQIAMTFGTGTVRARAAHAQGHAHTRARALMGAPIAFVVI